MIQSTGVDWEHSENFLLFMYTIFKASPLKNIISESIALKKGLGGLNRNSDCIWGSYTLKCKHFSIQGWPYVSKLFQGLLEALRNAAANSSTAVQGQNQSSHR